MGLISTGSRPLPRLSPCKRREFVRRLRKLGFEGPYSGTRHQFMVYEQYRQTIPSNTESSVPQLTMLLSQIGEILGRRIDPKDWKRL